MVFSTNHTKLPNIIQPPESLEANKSEEIVIYSIVLVVIFVSSVVGNFLVTLTLWRKGKMSPSNRFVFSLVFSNFMKDITIFPLIVTSFIKAQWIFGHAWCDIIAFLFLLVSTASILTTAAIAIDRYCAIVKTMVYRRTITSTKSLLMLLLTWTQAFCCSVPPFFGFPGYVYNPATHFCEADWGKSWIYSGCVILTCFLMPVIIMMFSYTTILRVAYDKGRAIHIGTIGQTMDSAGSHRSSISSQGNQGVIISSTSTETLTSRQILASRPSLLSLASGSQIKGVIIICIILGTLLFSWLPYMAAIMWTLTGMDAPAWFQCFSVSAAFTCSVTYPVVYGLLNRSIRNDMFTMLRLPQQRPLIGSVSKRFCSGIDLKESTFIEQIPVSILQRSRSIECTLRLPPSRWESQQSQECHSSQDSALAYSIEDYTLGNNNPNGQSIITMASLLEVPNQGFALRNHSVKRLSWAESTYESRDRKNSVTECLNSLSRSVKEATHDKDERTETSRQQLITPVLVVTAATEDEQLLQIQERVLKTSTLRVPQLRYSMATGAQMSNTDDGIVGDYLFEDTETEECGLQSPNKLFFS